MSDLIVVALKVGFLVLLWLFILFTGSVIRTDLFGRKVPVSELAEQPAPPTRKQRRAERGWPTSLVINQGSHGGESLPLKDLLLIGRSPDCQVILDDDDYVSTRHARIVKGVGGYAVEDLGSTNGTFVNNQRISQATPIGLGDTLRIGRTLMSLEK